MKKIYSLLFLSLFFTAYGGGFQVNLLGQRQIGMGHIGVALRGSASSIAFNPGSLSFMNHTFDSQVGFNLVKTNVAFQYQQPSDYTASSENPWGTPFSVYGAYKLNEKAAFGIGVYTPFGSSVSWEDDWRGRFLIQNISLRAIFVQPTFSYKLTDNIGLGAGLVIANGSVNLQRALPFEDQNGNEGMVELDGNTTALGFNAGLYIKISEKINVGIDYRSKVTMNLEDGDANFSVPASLSASFPSNNKFDAELPLASTLTAGLRFQVCDNFMMGLEGSYVGWDAYDSLIFDFKENTDVLEDSRNPREYKDAFIIRLGGEYTIDSTVAVRAGIYFDQAPSNEDFLTPETVDVNRFGLSAGASFSPNDQLDIDLSFLYILGIEREASYTPANFSGTYRVNGFVPGIGIRYHF